MLAGIRTRSEVDTAVGVEPHRPAPQCCLPAPPQPWLRDPASSLPQGPWRVHLVPLPKPTWFSSPSGTWADLEDITLREISLSLRDGNCRVLFIRPQRQGSSSSRQKAEWWVPGAGGMGIWAGVERGQSFSLGSDVWRVGWRHSTVGLLDAPELCT